MRRRSWMFVEDVDMESEMERMDIELTEKDLEGVVGGVNIGLDVVVGIIDTGVNVDDGPSLEIKPDLGSPGGPSLEIKPDLDFTIVA